LPGLIWLRNPIFFVKSVIFPGNFYQVHCVKVVDKSKKLLLFILMPFYWNLIMFLARSSSFYLFILIDRMKRLHGGSLPFLIPKEEEIADPIKEKGVDSPTIGPA
jgi:hypothetical protein